MAQSLPKAKTEMLVTILGCGTSVGVPMIGKIRPHHRNPKNQRLRASCLVEPFGRGKGSILIDTSPDLRQQVLRYFPKQNPRLDVVLMTHEHADHLHGLDDIRPFNFLQKSQIPFYGLQRTMDEIANRFSYIFYPTQVGGGLPQLSLNAVDNHGFRLLQCNDKKLQKISVTPLMLEHGKISCLGFRIGNFAYITDCSRIPDSTIAKMKKLDVLVLDCLRPRPHPTHLNIEQAITYAQRIKARRTIFTHMATEIEYEAFRKGLPRGMRPAYDGLQFRVKSQ